MLLLTFDQVEGFYLTYFLPILLIVHLFDMNERSQNLLKIRPEIPNAKVFETMSSEEWFQNSTLGPVIKLQNFLLTASLKNYITKHKNTFYKLSLEKRFTFIDNAIQKDIKYRNSLKGMIIGQFTVEEYEVYIQSEVILISSELWKFKKQPFDYQKTYTSK